jgi:hypothetical protein
LDEIIIMKVGQQTPLNRASSNAPSSIIEHHILAISAVCNSYVGSWDREKVERDERNHLVV